jgi:hypothetical protein
MLESIFLQLGPTIFTFTGKFFMFIFVNWWRKRWLSHIAPTITHEDIRASAEDNGLVPQITLSWSLVNRGMTEVTISRISGDLYIGAWRVGTFETDRPWQKQSGYSWSPMVSVTRKVLKKSNAVENTAGIEIVMFPPLEFWIADNYTCALYNAMVEVKSFWGTVVSPLSQENIRVENVESVSVRYRERLKVRLTSILH